MADPSVAEAFTRLVDLMARLRAPGGCPWDREQTPASLRPYLLEEVYEVLEAIDADDPAHLRDELGDLLLQIVFQSELAAEAGPFTVADAAPPIVDNPLPPPPPRFGDGRGRAPGDEVANEPAIKAPERRPAAPTIASWRACAASRRQRGCAARRSPTSLPRSATGCGRRPSSRRPSSIDPPRRTW